MGFTEDVKIDKHALDYELIRQASLYEKWSKKYSYAVAEKDRTKEQLDLIKAEIDSDIRRDPEVFGLSKKPTVQAIDATIIQKDAYKAALKKVIDANENVNILSGAIKALDHKKKALENLVSLWIGGYYAEPVVSKEDRSIIDEQNTKQNKEAIQEKLSKLKKRRKK